MNVPPQAVEAAMQALFEDGCGEPKVDAATALEAALPHIVRDIATLCPDEVSYHTLTDLADEMETTK